MCGQVGSLLGQRRPDRHAISVAGRAQIQARPKSVSCAAYPLPRHCRVQTVAFRPSHTVCGANPKAALASRVLLAPSCGGAVRERRLGFSDSVDAAGTGPSPLSAQQTRSLRTTAALALDPAAPPPGGAGLMRRTASLRNATWLILPVVICLSQRLSHACVSMNKFRL